MARLHWRRGRLEAARPLLEEVLGLDAGPDVAMNARITLGRVLDGLGQTDAAFAAFVEAKQGWRRTTGQRLDPQGFAELARRLAAWTADRDPAPAAAPAGDAPAILAGFPRSGLGAVARALGPNALCTGAVGGRPLVAVLSWFGETGTPYPEAVDTLNAETLDTLRQRYRIAARDAFGDRLDGGQLVEDTALNILHLGLLERLFPGARLAVALRDPREACLACLMTLFRPTDAFANFCDLDDTAGLYESAMGAWRALRAKTALAWTEFRYEAFAADPAGVAAEVADKLGLSAAAAPVLEPDPALGAWPRYRGTLAPVLDRLAPFAEAFDYPADTD
jgi:hypothetical protein